MEDEVRSVSQALVGGTELTTPSGTIAIGRQVEGVYTTYCSGVLVAPDLVLTARHCVHELIELDELRGIVCGATRFAQDAQLTQYRVSVAPAADYSDSDVSFGVTQVSIPDSDEACGFDVALLSLDGAVPAELVDPVTPRLGTPAVPGEALRAQGFGKDELGNPVVSGTLRENPAVEVDCVSGACSPLDEARLGPMEWVSRQTGVCPSDSGGPALDSEGHLLGVASRGPSDCSFTIYGDVNLWEDWLKERVSVAYQARGLAPPSWTSVDEPDGRGCGLALDDSLSASPVLVLGLVCGCLCFRRRVSRVSRESRE